MQQEIENHSDQVEIIPTPQPEKPAINSNSVSELFSARDLTWSSTGFSGGSTRKRSKRQTILFSWMAALIDLCVLLSLSSLFVLSFGLIVRTHFGVIFKAVSSNPKSILFFVEVFLFVSWGYMLMLRSLMGASLGEWACDLRLGRPTQRVEKSYFWRLLLRQSLIVLTGCCFFPLISFFVGQDVLGRLTGVKLESLP